MIISFATLHEIILWNLYVVIINANSCQKLTKSKIGGQPFGAMQANLSFDSPCEPFLSSSVHVNKLLDSLGTNGLQVQKKPKLNLSYIDKMTKAIFRYVITKKLHATKERKLLKRF